MTRRCYIVLALLLLCGSWLSIGWAQDLERLSERDVMGTARYVGLAGAMTAVGGDPSAALDNPAGLGIYRRMEVSATMDYQSDRTIQVVGNNGQRTNKMNFSHASWISHLPTFGNSRVVAHNFMLSYRRVRSYDRQYCMMQSLNPVSLADVVVLKTNGLPESDLKKDNCWDNEEIGWLSILGYQNYLIDTLGDKDNSWAATLEEDERVNTTLNIRETGYVNEYAFAWAMNVTNRFYLGADVNLQSFRLNRSAKYEEYPQNGGVIYNESNVLLNGVGANVALGVLYQPVRALRMGLSVQTPMYARLNVSSYGYMDASLVTPSTKCETPTNTVSYGQWMQPVRLSAGMAFFMKRYGLISVQYDFSGAMGYEPRHAVRGALELNIIDRVFVDLGYGADFMVNTSARQERFMENNRLDYNSVRTDTNFQRRSVHHFVGAGVGYRGLWGTAHLAYQFSKQNNALFAHEMSKPESMISQRHRIVLTLNWHTY